MGTSESRQRQELVGVRLTPQEKADVQAQADEAGCTIVGLIRARLGLTGAAMGTCPRCGSNAPHLHPAVQFEGEVELCTDDFHLRPTNQNSQQRIDMVLAKRAQLAVQ